MATLANANRKPGMQIQQAHTVQRASVSLPHWPHNSFVKRQPDCYNLCVGRRPNLRLRHHPAGTRPVGELEPGAADLRCGATANAVHSICATVGVRAVGGDAAFAQTSCWFSGTFVCRIEIGDRGYIGLTEFLGVMDEVYSSFDNMKFIFGAVMFNAFEMNTDMALSPP